MGDATVAMAAADPSTTILAVDVHTPVSGYCCETAIGSGYRMYEWPNAMRSPS